MEQKATYELELKGTVLEMQINSVEAEDMICIYSQFWSSAIKKRLFVGDMNSTLDTTTSEIKQYAVNANYYAPHRISDTLSTIDDFDLAISIANQHFTKRGRIEKLENANTKIAEKMRNLNNPPEGYEKAYEIAFEIYSLYEEYTSLAISPSGSLVSFNEKANNLSSNIIKKIKEFEVIMPLP